MKASQEFTNQASVEQHTRALLMVQVALLVERAIDAGMFRMADSLEKAANAGAEDIRRHTIERMEKLEELLKAGGAEAAPPPPPEPEFSVPKLSAPPEYTPSGDYPK